MDQKQMIIIVEGTAAIGTHWNTIFTDYLEKIVRAFAGTDSTGQNSSTSSVGFNLVSFKIYESHCGSLVQRSLWTKNVDQFLDWLSAIPFSSGDFSGAAIAEGLSEALMMFSIIPTGGQNQHNVDLQRHCILVAASNSSPLPSPVYRQKIQNELGGNTEALPESHLSDAETVAKSFPLRSVSLSVICPKQLPILKAIYNAGKNNPQSQDLSIYSATSPDFLVLISENFIEARAALSCPGVTNLALNRSQVKMEVDPVTSVVGPPPASILPVNGSMMNQQTSVSNALTATIKVEPTIASGPAFPSFPPTSSQEMVTGSDNMQEVKPSVGGTSLGLQWMGQPLSGMSQGNHLGGQMVQNGMGMNQNMTSGLGPSNVASVTGTTQGMPKKSMKIWEGDLFGIRQGQPQLITRLEAHSSSSASPTLAADWPTSMKIVRIISSDHMNNKAYVGKGDVLVFQAMTPHGFLGQLQEKKLCAVIQLPSQTMLLSTSDQPCRLIGMLFPGDAVVFKPKLPSHLKQQPQQLSQLPRQQQMLQLQQKQEQISQQLSQLHQQYQMYQLQQQQQRRLLLQQQQRLLLQQQQQTVGSGMTSTYAQGPGSSQVVSSSQGPHNMPNGGGFMS